MSGGDDAPNADGAGGHDAATGHDNATGHDADGELDLAGAPASEPEPVRPERRGRGGGVTGSVLAAAMLGLRDALEGKPKEDIVIQIDADGEPPDIDLTGLDDPLDDGGRMTGPPLEDLKERGAATRRRRGGRR